MNTPSIMNIASSATDRIIFFSTKCMDKFRVAPQIYLEPAAKPAAPESPDSTIYTCPMHPEIRRSEPGNCPICGMSLEALIPELDASENWLIFVVASGARFLSPWS